MSTLDFTKMHGIGNDYVYIDCTRQDTLPEDPSALSIRLSDRHKGIGGDGIILILPSDRADFRMRIFNADGSEAKMCGNGTRCVAKYVYDHGLTRKTLITLDTLSGIKTLMLHLGTDGKVDQVTVDMGAPILDCPQIPVIFDKPRMTEVPVQVSTGIVSLTAVSMGNPHGVVFVDSLEAIDFDRLGPELENHPMWPDRANIEFVEQTAPDRLKVRVWERGSGETMACGTGACAVTVAAHLTGRIDRHATISLSGGDLDITLMPDGKVSMRGSATEVFTGTLTI